MSTTSTNMNLVLPEVGTTTVNAAASELVVALEAIDNHDHSSGSGVKISPAGINIDADLEFNDNTLTGAHAVGMTSLASAITGAANANKIMAVNGELYFTDGSGTSVAITANGGLDTTTSGGWSGDYGSTAAEATYINATQVFKLMQNGNTNQAGLLDTGNIKLRTTSAGASNYVTILSPTLSSSYSITLPTAAPAATSIMTMTSAGVIATTKDLSITTLTMTGELVHGTKELSISAVAGYWENGYDANGYFTAGKAKATNIGDELYIPITLKVGDRITSIAYGAWGASTATKTVRVSTRVFGSTSATSLETDTFTTNSNHIGALTLSSAYTLIKDTTIYFTFIAGAVADEFVGIVVSYDHP